MKLLVDTQAALWLLADDPRLTRRARSLLFGSRHAVLLSAAVAWEVAIKRSLGKLEAPDGFAGQAWRRHLGVNEGQAPAAPALRRAAHCRAM